MRVNIVRCPQEGINRGSFNARRKVLRCQIQGMRCNGMSTCCDDLDDAVMPDKRLLILTAGMITVSWKSRIFLSGGCFSENMKNTPNATTTNSVVFYEKGAAGESANQSRS